MLNVAGAIWTFPYPLIKVCVHRWAAPVQPLIWIQLCKVFFTLFMSPWDSVLFCYISFPGNMINSRLDFSFGFKQHTIRKRKWPCSAGWIYHNVGNGSQQGQIKSEPSDPQSYQERLNKEAAKPNEQKKLSNDGLFADRKTTCSVRFRPHLQNNVLVFRPVMSNGIAYNSRCFLFAML